MKRKYSVAFEELLVNKYEARKQHKKPRNKKAFSLKEIEMLLSKETEEFDRFKDSIISGKDYDNAIYNINKDGTQNIIGTLKILNAKDRIVELDTFTPKGIKIKVSNGLLEKFKNQLLRDGLFGLFKVEKNDEVIDYFISEVEAFSEISTKDQFKVIENEREKMEDLEWINYLIISLGFNPSKLLFWEKIILLIRLIPLCEPNYNLLELGPKETGKTTIYEQLQPSTILVKGGATYPQIFFSEKDKNPGYIKGHDALVFDEIDKVSLNKDDVLDSIIKYINSGEFSRKAGERSDASIIFSGNIKDAGEQFLNKDFNIFKHLKENLRKDALFDKFHFFIPGWAMRKISNSNLSNEIQLGLRFEVLQNFFKELKTKDFLDDKDFERFNIKTTTDKELNAREERSIKKTVSGLIKLIHPNGKPKDEVIYNYIMIAFLGRGLLQKSLNTLNPSEFESYEYTTPNFDILSNFKRFINCLEGIDSKTNSVYSSNRIMYHNRSSYDNSWSKVALDAVGIEKNKKETTVSSLIKPIKPLEFKKNCQKDLFILNSLDQFYDYDNQNFDNIWGTNFEDIVSLDFSIGYNLKKNVILTDKRCYLVAKKDCQHQSKITVNNQGYSCYYCGTPLTSKFVKERIKDFIID